MPRKTGRPTVYSEPMENETVRLPSSGRRALTASAGPLLKRSALLCLSRLSPEARAFYARQADPKGTDAAEALAQALEQVAQAAIVSLAKP